MLTPQEKIRRRNQLVQQHQKLVWRIVHRMSSKCSEPQEDLFQEGCIGLIKAIERFDESLGNKFSSFAVPYIEGEIRHYLRDRSPSIKPPRNYQEIHSKVLRLQRHCAKLGRKLDEDAIASKIGVVEQHWHSIKRANKLRSCSWDELVYEPVEQTLEEDNYSHVYAGLSHLSPTQRAVIRSRYFLGKSEAQIAKDLNTSVGAIQIIIQEAIFTLNQYLSKND